MLRCQTPALTLGTTAHRATHMGIACLQITPWDDEAFQLGQLGVHYVDFVLYICHVVGSQNGNHLLDLGILVQCKVRLDGEQFVLHHIQYGTHFSSDTFLVIQHTNECTQFIDRAVSFYPIVILRNAQATYQRGFAFVASAGISNVLHIYLFVGTFRQAQGPLTFFAAEGRKACYLAAGGRLHG